VGVKFLGLRFAIVVNGIEYGAQNAVDKWVKKTAFSEQCHSRNFVEV
jgi:hypothetical protein